MNLRIIYLQLIFILLQNYLSAQEQNVSTFLPDSPTVSSLGKYIDFPISLYTGQAEVSIPIYNLTVNDINLPISLKYHTGGVKVEDIASSVGLNWSLIANGTIIRQINGAADGPNNPFFYEQPPYDLDHSTFLHHKSAYSGSLNTEHDYYYFSAGSYSGKYVIDFLNNSTPVLFPHQDIKVRNAYDANTPIKITTPDGLIYTYGATESNRTFISCTGNPRNSTGNPDRDITTWFLTRIDSQTTDAFVEFDYESTYLEYKQNGSQTKYKNIISSKIDSDCEITNRIYSNRLIAIESSDGQKIDFIKGSLRADLKDDYLLSQITITNNQSSLSKQFKLIHKYLDGSVLRDINDYDPNNIPNWQREKLRLVLTGVQESGNDNSTLPPYSFEYNITDNGLPSRRSFSQDHWGYFNGANNNTLVPPIVFQGYLLPGADRRPSLVSAINGTLSKINFPTGGSKSFIYELNECENCSFLDYDSASNPQDETYLIEDGDYFANQNQNLFEKTFDVDKRQQGNIILDLSTDTSFHGNIELKLYSLNEDNTINEVIFDSYDEVEGKDEEELNTLQVVKNYTFSGKYKLQLKINNHEWAKNQDKYSLIVKWLLPLNTEGLTEYRNAGGLRTQQIKLYDASMNKTIQKNYSYQGGYLNGWQNYAMIENYNNYDDSGKVKNQVQVLRRNSNPILATSKTKGGVVGYNKVTVSEQGNGYIENYFYSPFHHPDKGLSDDHFNTTFTDYPDDFTADGNTLRDNKEWKYPFSLIDEKDWKRGLLKESKVYDDSGFMVKNILNKYNFYDNPYDSIYDSEKIHVVNGSRTFGFFWRIYTPTLGIYIETGIVSVNFYSLESSWYDLDEIIETNYFKDGSKVITTTQHEYSDNQRTVKSKTMTNSKGGVLKTTTLFPTDSNTTISNLMVSKNMLKFPLLKKQEINTINISEVQNIYQNTNENINLSQINTFNKGNEDPNIINIVSNSYGNTIEVTKANGTSTVYIWGYNNRFPVAKIENSSYLTIKNLTGFTSELSVIERLSPAQEETLRNDLNSQVTTYTYDPLIGVTSITDPRGRTVYYEYDSFNRLKYVKDHDGNILSKNEYNYKN